MLLPLLDDIKDAVAMAKSWLENSAPFLVSSSSMVSGSVSSLKLEVLKVCLVCRIYYIQKILINHDFANVIFVMQELVSHSKLLKISLDERRMLEMVLKNCDEWQQDANSALQDARCILSTDDIDDGKNGCLFGKVEHLATKMESITKAGLSLNFDFAEIPKLQNACSMLRWCSRALSFCTCAPSLEVVLNLYNPSICFFDISIFDSYAFLLIQG